MAKAKLIEVKTKKGDPTEYRVEVLKHEYVSIFKNGELVNLFVVGDEAEYDSYNLSYTGKIVGITDSRVTIRKPHANGDTYLSMYEFCWRNYGFDAEQVAQKNHEAMQYL